MSLCSDLLKSVAASFCVVGGEGFLERGAPLSQDYTPTALSWCGKLLAEVANAPRQHLKSLILLNFCTCSLIPNPPQVKEPVCLILRLQKPGGACAWLHILGALQKFTGREKRQAWLQVLTLGLLCWPGQLPPPPPLPALHTPQQG